MAAPDTVGNTAFPHYLSGALSGAPIGPLARSPNWLAAATRMGDGRPMTEDTSPAGWWLDELAHAGPEHLDPAFVAGYDRKQGYPSVAADLARMRELGALTAHATVLDLGAGTGRFSLAAARECAQVIAVDVSEPMVDHLAGAGASEGLGNLTVVRSGLLGYVHDGPPVDGVFCRNVLHQVPDFWKGIALDRTATMLRPGGVLLLHDLVYDVEPSAAVGSPVGPPTLSTGTPGTTSPRTSAPSTAPTRGCWSRCSNGPGSRSSTGRFAPGCTPRTPVFDDDPRHGCDTCATLERLEGEGRASQGGWWMDAEPGFVEFATARSATLFRTAWLLTGDWHLAQDLVQETLGRLYVHWAKVAAADQPEAYARSVLVRTFLSHRRRRSSSERPSELVDIGQAVHEADSDLRVTLLGALSQLDRLDRTVVVLRYWQDLDAPSTGELVGLSATAVRTRCSRALARLREVLGDDLAHLLAR
jgi:RNA polymerase sigma-70 factor (sigma-E family)